MTPCTTRECFVVFVLWKRVIIILNAAWSCLQSINTDIPILRLSLFIHHYPSTSTIASNNSTGSANKANVSGIAESRVPDDQAAPFPPVHTVTSRRTKLLRPSRHIAGSDIPARCMEVATMESQSQSGSLTSRMHPYPSEMYAAWSRYTRLKITCDMLENRTVCRKQSSNKQLFRLGIKRVRLVNSCRVRSDLVDNMLGLFQVPASVVCDYLGVVKPFKYRFVDVVAQGLFVYSRNFWFQ